MTFNELVEADILNQEEIIQVQDKNVKSLILIQLRVL